MNLFLLVIITVREPLMHVICILSLKVKGIKDRIKSYDFIEGVDFQSFTEIVEREIGATKRIEYALSISMAKELSMIENNERGRQARKYFIACEENKHELSRKELALMVIQAEEEKERLALENKKQQKQIEKLQPKADFADAAFKKILFSFGSMESLRNFVPFTDDDCIRYVKQAVKLPYHTCFFYALIGYWRLPLRKIIVFALVANAPSVNSVKCNRFLFDKVATYNFL